MTVKKLYEHGYNDCGVAIGITDIDITFHELGCPKWVKYLLLQHYDSNTALSLWYEHDSCHYGEPSCILCQIGI